MSQNWATKKAAEVLRKGGWFSHGDQGTSLPFEAEGKVWTGLEGYSM